MSGVTIQGPFGDSQRSKVHKRAVLSQGGFGGCALVPVIGGPGISKIMAFFCQGSTTGKDFLEKLRCRGTAAKTTLLETTLLRTPKKRRKPLFSGASSIWRPT